MFLGKELLYQLRKKGQTAVLIAASMLLIGCMTFYLGNMRSTQSALDGLAENAPVTVTVTSGDGQRRSGLSIDTEHFDALIGAGVRDVRCLASFAGALKEEAQAQKPFHGGDTAIVGANSAEAAGLDTAQIRFQEGQDDSLFSGTENKAIAGENYTEEYDLKLGDTVTLPIYLMSWTADNNLIYLPVGEISCEIAGICSAEGAADSGVSLYLPVDFLREKTMQAGKNFFYQSLSCVLEDPMALNEWKKRPHDLGFSEAYPQAFASYSGNTLVIDDELFIKAAGRLRQNLTLFQTMLFPFLGLILFLSLLTVFLTLRGSRREMAVSLSLGQPRWAIIRKYLLFVFTVDLIASGLMFPVICLAARLSPAAALGICGLFSAAMLPGGWFALLLLLRFEPIELLTKRD